MAGKKSKKRRESEGVSKSGILSGEVENLAEESLHERCRRYYQNSREKYDAFFLKCVEEIEFLQPSAFACVQAMRYFVVGILPRYCVLPDPLTKKERERVEKILAS